jgi:hypothetical protein
LSFSFGEKNVKKALGDISINDNVNGQTFSRIISAKGNLTEKNDESTEKSGNIQKSTEP